MFFYTNGKFICKRHIMYILFRLQTLKDTTVVNIIGYQNFYINCLFQAIYCLKYLPMTQYRDFFQSLARQVYLYKIK